MTFWICENVVIAMTWNHMVMGRCLVTLSTTSFANDLHDLRDLHDRPKGLDVLAKRALDGRAHLQFQTVLTWLERYDMIWQGTVTEMTCVAVQCMYNVSIEYNWIDAFFGAVCAPKVSAASPLALRSPVAVSTCRRFDVSQVLSGCFTFKFDVDSLGSLDSTFFRNRFHRFHRFPLWSFFGIWSP